MPKIINVVIRNILGIREAKLNPNGKSLVIGGRNRQGKSSAQRALLLALDAKANMPSEPVHRGAEQGDVELVLDNGMRIHRVIKVDGKTTLTIRQHDNPGVRFDKPANTLKALFGELAFDPHEFGRMSAKERRDTCLALGGVDTAKIDALEDKAREDRRNAGRDVARLEGDLSGKPWHEGIAPKEVDQASILEELERANVTAAAIREHQSTHDSCEQSIETATREREALTVKLNRINPAAKEERAAEEAEYQKQLEALRVAHEHRLASIERRRAADLDSVGAEVNARTDAIKSAQLQLLETSAKLREIGPSPNTEEIRARLASVAETNAKARDNREHLAAKEKLEEARKRHDDLETQIANLQKNRDELLAAAKLPIDGLTITATGLRFNGTPFDDCSESERDEVSAAIACALNPNGVVCMLESGGKDWDAVRRTVEIYETAGVQAFIEVVNDDPDVVDIVFEQGAVKVDRTLETAANASLAGG